METVWLRTLALNHTSAPLCWGCTYSSLSQLDIIDFLSSPHLQLVSFTDIFWACLDVCSVLLHLPGNVFCHPYVPRVKAVFFSKSHVWMWKLDCEKGWEAPKKWSFQTVVLKTLENPLDNMEIKPVNPKGNQLWIFIGRNDAEAEAPILWPPDVESWLIGKDLHAGKDWGQEKGVTEDEIGWMSSPTQWTWV